MDLLCIGNAMVDVFARVEERILDRLGINAPVQHIPAERAAALLEALPHPRIVSGGGAANTAKIAALLGVSTGFIGTVGSDRAHKVLPGPDAMGRRFTGELSRAGVSLFLNQQNRPTGLCFYLESGGERRIAASPSAALLLSAADIKEETLREARALVLDGHIQDEGLIRFVLAAAEKYRIPLALDAGSPALAAARAKDLIRYCRAYPLILFLNEDEGRALYEAAAGTPAKPEKLRAFFRETAAGPFPLIALKQGARGARIFARGGEHRVKTRALRSVETAGAGDAFCAGFMAGWLQNKPPEECGDLGNRTAREILAAPLTGRDIPPPR